MRVVKQLDPVTWRAFVDGHPHGNIFQTPEMFAVFDRAQAHRPQVWAVLDEPSHVLALLVPVHISLMDGLLRRLTTRSIVHGGVLCEQSDAGYRALELLLTTYAANNRGASLFTELRNIDDPAMMHGIIADCGFVYEDHLNFLVDLNRSSAEILGDMGSKTRKHIRKGLREGIVQVRTIEERAELPAWYDVLRQTYRNVRVPLADRSLFEAAFDVLHPLGMARFLAAQIDGVTVACSIELCYKRTIYGWYGGSNRAYSKYTPNELLNWHILEWGADNGYHVYDFGGAGKLNEDYGVRDFKAKFGGALVNFGRYLHVHSGGLLKLSKLGYSLYRNLL